MSDLYTVAGIIKAHPPYPGPFCVRVTMHAFYMLHPERLAPDTFFSTLQDAEASIRENWPDVADLRRPLRDTDPEDLIALYSDAEDWEED